MKVCGVDAAPMGPKFQSNLIDKFSIADHHRHRSELDPGSPSCHPAIIPRLHVFAAAVYAS